MKQLPVYPKGTVIRMWNYQDNCINELTVISSSSDHLAVWYREKDERKIGNITIEDDSDVDAFYASINQAETYNTPLYAIMQENE